ncbi:MAG: type II toxin-antitoxin system VapC family toxin [Actinomycetota bacterium]
MIEVVLDASVVLKWFAPQQRGSAEAREIRREYEAGQVSVTVPGLFFLEMLNVAGRRWGWDEEALLQLAAGLEDLLFEVAEPDLGSIASWVARGLTAYDAAYVALAGQLRQPLVTDDQTIVEIAGEIARPLVGEGATGS